MKGYKLEQTKAVILGSKGAIAASAFLFIIGISSGVFLEISMESAAKTDVLQFITKYLNSSESGIDYPNPFKSGAANNLFLLALMMLSGLVTIGFPLAYAVTLYKGIVIGFSVGLMFESYSFSAVLPILISIMPQNLFFIPTFILAAAASQNYALASYHTGSIPKRRYKKSNSLNSSIELSCYIIAYILFAICIISGCLIEAAIFPLLTF